MLLLTIVYNLLTYSKFLPNIPFLPQDIIYDTTLHLDVVSLSISWCESVSDSDDLICLTGIT